MTPCLRPLSKFKLRILEMGNPRLERKGDGVLTLYILIVGRLTILVSPRLDGWLQEVGLSVLKLDQS